MASAQNFRTSIKGFHREDVVRYIEYLNARHTGVVNQLKSENQTLADELAALRANPAMAEECARLQEENAQLKAQVDAQNAQIEDLKKQLEEALKVKPLTDEELEAYRRAEKAERTARERARQIYCQATGALADASVQVDDAAEQFQLLSQRISTQLTDLQTMVERSKNALQSASATMYAICPNEGETL